MVILHGPADRSGLPGRRRPHGADLARAHDPYCIRVYTMLVIVRGYILHVLRTSQWLEVVAVVRYFVPDARCGCKCVQRILCSNVFAL